MAVRKSDATWLGTLKEGSGTMRLGSGMFEGPFTYVSRFEEGKGTDPEELVGAAHAGCFSMFLSALLTNEGFTPTRVQTSATVHLGAGPAINKIELDCEAEVPGRRRRAVCRSCRKSQGRLSRLKALAAVPEITLNARLLGS